VDREAKENGVDEVEPTLARSAGPSPAALRETPGERLFRLGTGALSDGELIELLLGSGTAGHPARAIAERLLSLGPGLKELSRRDARELTRVAGMGPARAARVAVAWELGRRVQRSEERRPRLRTPAEIYRYLAPQLSSLRKEVFHVLSMNSRNVLLNDSKVAEGTMNACPVDPREVFSAAIGARATAIVLAHNHPSGDPEPSEMDLSLSAQLAEGGRILGIRVLDHIVVGDGGFVSLFERGKLSGSFERRRLFHARGLR
jgi:DNA repair protein RadC